jgi:hypothetical protein
VGSRTVDAAARCWGDLTEIGFNHQRVRFRHRAY